MFFLYSAVAHGMIAVGVNTDQIQAQIKSHTKVVINVPILVEAKAEMRQRRLSVVLKQVGDRKVLSSE